MEVFFQKTAVFGVRALFSPAMKGYPKSSVRTKRLCTEYLPCISIFFNTPPACYRTENQQKASFPETGFLLEIQDSVMPTARNSAAWGTPSATIYTHRLLASSALRQLVASFPKPTQISRSADTPVSTSIWRTTCALASDRLCAPSLVALSTLAVLPATT